MGKKSFTFLNFIGDENGSAIVIALLVLLALSIIGIATMTTSQFETQVATNDVLYKKAFYSADGGIEIAREMIEQNLSCAMGFPNDLAPPVMTATLKHLCFEDPNTKQTFLRVTDLDFAYQASSDVDADSDGIVQPAEAQPSDTNKDIWFGDNAYTFNQYDTNNAGIAAGEIDNTDNMNLPHTSIVAFGDSQLSTGNAIQMAAGYEGVGKGTAGGGGKIVYQIHSRYEHSLRNNISYIMVNYRHFIGQEGNCQF